MSTTWPLRSGPILGRLVLTAKGSVTVVVFAAGAGPAVGLASVRA